MRILGITGGIATGKSTVMAMLAERGALTESADAIARAQMQSGSKVTRAVLDAFPQCADPHNSESVNRAALASVIFADEQARARLESITHPPIIAALWDTARKWRASEWPCGALEIPLLFEAHLEAMVDEIIVVACRAETQASRLMARWNIERAEAEKRIGAQWPLSEKMARARTVITTDGMLGDTRFQVETLWNDLCR